MRWLLALWFWWKHPETWNAATVDEQWENHYRDMR